ncbi:MAG TPA: ribokinase [Intrasporangium sp.]|nr:ribokinase [Intrasporangium sp.]
MPGTIIVVGSLNADLTITTARLPGPGETVAGRDFSTRPGGKGANQAVAAARLGGRVRMVGAVGQDDHGDLLMRSAEANGVDTSLVRRLAATPTGVAVIQVDERGENSIVVYPGANGTVTSTDIERIAPDLAEAAVVCLCFETPMRAVIAAATTGRGAGATVILNPSPYATVPAELLAVTSALVVNEHEAAALFEVADVTADWPSTVAAVRRCFPGDTVITLGGSGSVVIEAADPAGADARWTPVPALTVDVVDTTGSGDAFLGALALGYAESIPVIEAARRASVVAGLAAARPGAQTSYPTIDEVGAVTLA